ncbi:F5/8 type C domain protein [Stieleria bergensis]|uniref:F5/8 type C domain protein n=1 Tax=Stieleria bergensis TaxID=2528025 RepID=A0A517SW74_9BACT|nr:F5/8 type C domain protein [Planctomycetes bacterium SV_7m_r]
MKRLLFTALFLSGMLQVACAESGEQNAVPLKGITDSHLKTLRNYCADCHSSDGAEGKFRVDNLPMVVSRSQDAEKWQKILNVLNAGEMPPVDAEQLRDKEKVDLVDNLAQAMVELRNRMADRHGRITMSRLNRREFGNSLKALLGVEIDVSELPSDHGLGNFDTNGANLFVSPAQLESYLSLGKAALDESIDRYLSRETTHYLRHEAELLTQQYHDHFEKTEAASQWRKELAEVVARPENKAAYDAAVAKDPKRKPFHLFYDQIKGAPPVPDEPKFRFFNSPDRLYQFATSTAYHIPYLKRYFDLPAIDKGAYISVPTLHPSNLPTYYIAFSVPANWSPGKYRVRFRAARSADAPPERRFLEFGVRVRNMDLLSAHEITGTMDEPQIVETTIELTRKILESADHSARQLYLREKAIHYQLSNKRKIFAEAKKRNGYGPEYAFWIDWVEVEKIPHIDEPASRAMEAVASLLGDGIHFRTPVQDQITIPTGSVHGQTVRVVNGDSGSNDHLHLRELQVMSNEKNVGLAGTATQSSTNGSVQSRGPQLVNDGDLSTYNHTKNDAKPGEWWQVDLGREMPIDKIVLHNRNDSSTVINRLKSYWIEIYDAEGELVWGGNNGVSPARLKQGLEAFAAEAFRGAAPSEAYINSLVGMYQDRMTSRDDMTHREAVTDVLSTILGSPMFLYKAESSLAEKQEISQQELAQRLSYFLWSAPADPTLTKLADSGQLSDPEVLRQQTDRLLDDPRSREMIEALSEQWLDMERLDFFNVDFVKHRTFDIPVKMSVRNEIYETLQYLLEHNRSIKDLLSSDYVVINNVLAQFYGIKGRYSDKFQRVDLPKSSPRGGLLGMAAIHLMGSNGVESSPVERGAWVLRKLLNNPPPPAPANVPAISRLQDQLVNVRDRLSIHQEEAQCASCHRKIDPIGLGLENFDAVGLWRTKAQFTATTGDGDDAKTETIEWKIDPSGQLHKGPKFKDYLELRRIIASHSDEFARGFATALAEYGMGRTIGFSDSNLVESIVADAKQDDYAIRSFIHALVQSQTFQYK